MSSKRGKPGQLKKLTLKERKKRQAHRQATGREAEAARRLRSRKEVRERGTPRKDKN